MIFLVLIESAGFLRACHIWADISRYAPLKNVQRAREVCNKYIYVTGFGKTGLIAGLVKIDFFPESVMVVRFQEVGKLRAYSKHL